MALPQPWIFSRIRRFSVFHPKGQRHATLNSLYHRSFFDFHRLFRAESGAEWTGLDGISDRTDLSAEHRLGFAVDSRIADEAADDPRFRQTGT